LHRRRLHAPGRGRRGGVLGGCADGRRAHRLPRHAGDAHRARRGARDRRRPAGARLQRRADGSPLVRRGGRMATVTISEPSAPASARPRLGRMAARIVRMEIRHSAFMWVIPLVAILFIYDPYRTAAGYPALWPLRSTVVLNKFWPDLVVFAAGFSAWGG